MDVIVRRLSVLLFCLLLSGCARQTALLSEDSIGEGIELTGTPFFPQDKYQCGPAALAALLGTSGVVTTQEALSHQLYLPARRGSLQLELKSTVRRHGRLPYIIDPTLSAILAELRANRPVLVLQNLGLSFYPIYHYAVVVGILPGNRIILHSGTQKRLTVKEANFTNSWRKANTWAMVVLVPGELPALVNRERYLKEVAALETSGQWKTAEQGYRAALARWPDEITALFGLANTLLMQEQPEQAVKLYEKILQLVPHHLQTGNNLAEALLQLGCHHEALTVIDKAIKQCADNIGLCRTLWQTRGEILDSEQSRHSGNPACGKLYL